jgi:hypothetical protein
MDYGFRFPTGDWGLPQPILVKHGACWYKKLGWLVGDGDWLVLEDGGENAVLMRGRRIRLEVKA